MGQRGTDERQTGRGTRKGGRRQERREKPMSRQTCKNTLTIGTMGAQLRRVGGWVKMGLKAAERVFYVIAPPPLPRGLGE